ncbi:GNAT family N-acetyltransferase [Bacillus sp. NTK071]|uniref:GNAT family N-acetyltransferase n=1 Tax=Bacillus sp. NTK071 TaxID=2802175 RepID=UPI0025704B5B|nr:GNAT family protein [Bacillus sp. NTK071]
MYHIQPMTLETAKEIQTWTYTEPYSLYSFSEDEEVLEELMDGSYVSVWNGRKLFGYFCFGKSARVPSGHDAGVYEEDLLDIGLGIHPDEIGKGNGKLFLRTGLQYVIEQFGEKDIRLSVASFNIRARKVYEREGFVVYHSFVNRTQSSKVPFEVMIKRIEN